MKETLKRFKDLVRLLMASLAAVFYRCPSRGIFVLGLTGTKGKTLTLELINAVLERAGKKTALLSSTRIKIDRESGENLTGNTMPGRAFIQRFLRRAVDRKMDYVLIEVTSEGIARHIHEHIDWDAGLFLNLHPEHIEAHGSFENYRSAKVEFFKYIAECSRKKPKYFFINKDDFNAKYFEEAAAKNKIIYFGGGFLRANYAAAEAVGRTLGLDEKIIKEALEEFKGLPGRMEFIQKKPFIVLIDYAHTPESLAEVYKYAVSLNPRKIIGVLGSAGGGRDKWKRPKLGEIAAGFCDELVLTNEDPYDEDPLEIIEEIGRGAEESGSEVNLYKILDREEAIEKAVSLAGEGDAVLITGKGSEPYIHLARGKKLPWSDKKTALQALAQNEEKI